ncbi:hypothetical protein [Oryzomonas rubra]|uniref:Uncharacterized protein n=1 Tax=Oryzomonas rubra TaxID=2509454 RepID=A0A5A9X8M9_9BACT|nr:hypothetical protein [Oryzomonas rubra]KAA0888755.1 hypothetical protein ET418_15355 [Oryzomonas rubra]
MSNCKLERNKLIPQVIAETDNSFKGKPVSAVEWCERFQENMDKFAQKNWLVSNNSIPVDLGVLKKFMADQGMLPTQFGQIVIHCSPKDVKKVEFKSV